MDGCVGGCETRFLSVVPTQPFELPDGSILEVDGDRLRLPELYFDPAPVAVGS